MRAGRAGCTPLDPGLPSRAHSSRSGLPEPGARPRRTAPAVALRDALSVAIGKCSTAANTRGRTANVDTGRTKYGLRAAAQSARVHPVRGRVGTGPCEWRSSAIIRFIRLHPVHPPSGCGLRAAQRGELPRSQSRAALRWDFAVPGAANFHDAGLCGVALGLRRARRGKLPWRRAVPRCVWNFAATPPGGRDALHTRTRAEEQALLRQGGCCAGCCCSRCCCGKAPVRQGARAAGWLRARCQWRSEIFNRR